MKIKIIFPIFQIQSMDILLIIKENFHLATHQYLRLRALHETYQFTFSELPCACFQNIEVSIFLQASIWQSEIKVILVWWKTNYNVCSRTPPFRSSNPETDLSIIVWWTLSEYPLPQHQKQKEDLLNVFKSWWKRLGFFLCAFLLHFRSVLCSANTYLRHRMEHRKFLFWNRWLRKIRQHWNTNMEMNKIFWNDISKNWVK